MGLTLFHGSERVISAPVYGLGKRTNDYGRGFYCTETSALAGEWACGDGRDGFINTYDLQMEDLQVLYLNKEPYTILHWMALLANYRGYWQQKSVAEEAKEYLQTFFLPDIGTYDLIVGYRADDSYFSFAQDFISGGISLQQLSKAMHLGKLGEQIVLKSPAAFSKLQFLSAEAAYAKEYYLKKVQRDREARLQYRNMRAERSALHDIFMLDIMREGMKGDDPRLR